MDGHVKSRLVLPLCGRVCPTAEVLICVDKPCGFTLSSTREWRVTDTALSVGDSDFWWRDGAASNILHRGC